MDVRCAKCYVASDLYEKMGEDQMLILNQFYVVVEFPNGTRYAHYKNFKGSSECDSKPDELRAEALATRVRAKGTIDMKYWFQIHSAYGSDAYVKNDEEAAFLAWEKSIG